MSDTATINTIDDAFTYLEQFLVNRSASGSERSPQVWEEIKRLAKIGAQAEAELSAFDLQFPKKEETSEEEQPDSRVERLETVTGKTQKEVMAQLPDMIRRLNSAEAEAAPPSIKQ